MDDKVIYWVEMSDYDVETADAMLATGRYLYVGFMCHQTIEKILKAYWSNCLEEIPLKIHSLSRLADQALSLAEGNIWTAARNVNEYVQDSKHRKEGGVQSIDNPGTLYEGRGESIGDLDPDKITSVKTRYINHSLGNMFQSTTIANNI